MSGNQSRFDKSEYRKPNRSGTSSGTYQRSYVNKNSAGSGGGGSGHPNNRSFKKSNNVQGGQSGVSLQPNVAVPTQSQYNGVVDQPIVHGTPVAASEFSSRAQESSLSPRSQGDVPSSQSAALSSHAKLPTTPVKEETPKPIAVQFGSISPGFVNRIQIPPRTISAPPNLDEQKRNQARAGSLQAVPTVPVPTVPKQQLPEKEAAVSKPVHAADSYLKSMVKKEPQVSPVPSSSLPQKPATLPTAGIPIQVPFLQQQSHLPYGVPNPPILPQGIAGASMHMHLPMHYPTGNAPQLQHQIFMHNFQHHPMKHQGMMHQGMMHQGQVMSFNPQVGPHMSHQLGMNMPPPQYAHAPQQTVSFPAPRKTVVITHPETREELKLDKRGDKDVDGGSSGSRSRPNVPANKSQAYNSNTSSPSTHFYPNSFNSSPSFVPCSISAADAQRTPSSHAPWYNSVSQGPPALAFGAPSVHSIVPVSVSVPVPSGLVKTERVNDTQVGAFSIPASAKSNSNLSEQSSTTVAVKADSKLGGQGDAKQKVFTNLTEESKSYVSNPLVVNHVAAATAQDSALGKVSVEDSLNVSTKNPQKKLEEKGSAHDQPEDSTLSTTILSPLETVNDNTSSVTDITRNFDGKNDTAPLQTEPPTDATYGRQEIAIEMHTNDGTNENIYRPPRPDSKHSDMNKNESGVPLDKLAFEAAASSDSVTTESSDQGSHMNAPVGKNVDPAMKSAILGSDLISGNGQGDDKNIGDSVSSLPVTSKDKTLPDQNRPKGKKKFKEMLQKADEAGSTSDIYNAYKAPEKHKEIDQSPESEEAFTVMDEEKSAKMMPGNDVAEDSNVREADPRNKGEPDDWEDAADVATPEAGASDNREQHEELVQHESQCLIKKYSRDFLLKFQSLINDLPEGICIAPTVANGFWTLNATKGHLDQNSYSSPGRHSGGPRLDHHGAAAVGDRWNKVHGQFVHNQDTINNAGVSRHVQGGNSGMLRTPRQVPGQLPGINHAGPPQADRWPRGSNFQKGLIPPPQTPMQMMHKAEKKYELGKATDEEQVKQRSLKAILNKLTPQNFDKLFKQVKAVNIDSVPTLTGVIAQIFDKALMEPTFCEMYADFCGHLSRELPDLSDENEKITFKRLLLNKCQEEFEKGEREQEEANKSEDSEITMTKVEREERRVLARRRMLGNIRFIGELFKKKMLTERIMHECIKKLLGNNQQETPDEEDLEALCKLMSTIGEMIDHHAAKPFIDAYFDRMGTLSFDMNLSSRVRFMLKDAIDLRKNKWQQRRKIEGPKKIDDVHRDAAQERQAQANRLDRGPGSNASGRRIPPSEFGSRGSNPTSSLNSHSSNFRGYPSHSRGMGHQDIRSEDRHSSFENRTLSVPLRAARDDSITLGPQGGLARGMSSRGPTSFSSAPQRDRPLSSGESRRAEFGYNGNNSMTERPTSSSSDDAVGRFAPERYTVSSPHDKHVAQDSSIPSDIETRNLGSSFDTTSKTPPANKFSEDRLQEMSLAAIKEFYSAKDEKELISCINDLNTPSYYPSMIALWVTDSFERKDVHRDLLTSLLINLSQSTPGIISQLDLLKGFESVLATLEDAVNDAPKAPEFLGHILAKSVVEKVIPLADISSILHEGGEEPGALLESGLAGDVLGIILEAIQTDKGDSIMKQILTSANLRLEDFRPPEPTKYKKLDKFLS